MHGENVIASYVIEIKIFSWFCLGSHTSAFQDVLETKGLSNE